MADYKALYRKWRPKDFDDVSGQNGITDILKYEVDNNKLSHAYLFCGSRGTGKTSCAKILAKAVNCLHPVNGNPCNECEVCKAIDRGVCTDVIEMDAASNNGVDDVRKMIEEVSFTPSDLKYRVYIIDEVHMMSSSAFNALLKTLEEPPKYVIFILATTELHKIPITIVSRCQRFDFRRLSSENIISRLKTIAENENIQLTDDGARIIARISRGGMRDAISFLELCSVSGKTIDENVVFDNIGIGNREKTYKIVKAVVNKDYSTVYEVINDVVNTSGDVLVFWQEIIDTYRDIMVIKYSSQAKEYLDLTDHEYKELCEIANIITPAKMYYHISILEDAMADMQRAFNSKRSIAEIALTKMCDAKTEISTEALSVRIEDLEKELSLLKLSGGSFANNSKMPETVEVLPTVKTESISKEINKTDDITEQNNKNNVSKSGKLKLYEDWEIIKETIKSLRPSMSSKLEDSKVYIRSNGTYLIRISDFWSQDLKRDPKQLTVIRGAIAQHENVPAEEINILLEPFNLLNNNDIIDELIEQDF